MKKLGVLLLLSAGLMSSCVDQESNAEIVRLNQEKHELIQQGVEQDSLISAYLQSINDIEESLGVIKEKERIINVNSQDPEFNKDKANQIIEDIQLIHNLLEKSRERVNNLQSQLKASGLQVAALQNELERLTLSMNSQLDAKDQEIGELKSELASLNADFEILIAEYEQEVKEKGEVTDELNTAWYAYGTKKELKENGVLGKSGGFAGIGGAKNIKQDFNKEYFTQVDIRTLKTIDLPKKSVSLLSNHPKGSYELVGDEKAIEQLVIQDAREFWSVSKYLVIVID